MRLADLFSWNRMRSLSEIEEKSCAGVPEKLEGGVACKLLPVIDRDYCTGCRACIDACDNGCLELVWDFATLQRAEDCASDGMCTQACPEGLIRMEWLASTGSRGAGKWQGAAVPGAR